MVLVAAAEEYSPALAVLAVQTATEQLVMEKVVVLAVAEELWLLRVAPAGVLVVLVVLAQVWVLMVVMVHLLLTGLVAEADGAHLVALVLKAAQQVAKQLTSMVNQLLGQAVTPQEFTGAYRDIFNYTAYYGATI
jgi:hypothetical protein